jgi:hypothetical protein
MGYGQFLMSKKVLVEMTRFHFTFARKTRDLGNYSPLNVVDSFKVCLFLLLMTAKPKIFVNK